jgi:3-oxoadipate enol-lactonase
MPTSQFQASRLHYEISGSATGAVVVFVNSLGANMQMWDKVTPLLEQDCRVLRYDARGLGLSAVPAIPSSIDHLGGDLLNLLDELSIESINLCGLSLGGLVGMWLGIHAPQKLTKLVLANTAARIGTREGWDARIAAVRSHGMASVVQATLGRWFTSDYCQQHTDEMHQIRKMIERTSPEGYIGCCSILRDTDLRSQLSAIEAPCLVITGSEDPATPPQDGLELHLGLRYSTYLELNASHLSAWEQSEQFAGAILDFFNGKERANG